METKIAKKIFQAKYSRQREEQFVFHAQKSNLYIKKMHFCSNNNENLSQQILKFNIEIHIYIY